MDPLSFDGRGARRKKDVAAESDRAVGEGGVMGGSGTCAQVPGQCASDREKVAGVRKVGIELRSDGTGVRREGIGWMQPREPFLR